MENRSEKIEEVVKALIAAQKNIGTLTKNKQVKGKGFSWEYADLAAVIEAIKEPLNENNVLLTQAVNVNGEGVAIVETQLIHESGQWIGSRTPVFCNRPNDAQAFGTGVSYAKRYALMALLGLPTEDDNGEAASKKKKATVPKPTDEEQAAIDKIYDELLEYAKSKGLVPVKDSIRAYYYSNSKSRTYPTTREHIDRFITFIKKTDDHLIQICEIIKNPTEEQTTK